MPSRAKILAAINDRWQPTADPHGASDYNEDGSFPEEDLATAGYIVITQTASAVYTRLADDLYDAVDMAGAYMANDICTEWPVGIVNLETGEPVHLSYSLTGDEPATAQSVRTWTVDYVG